MLAGYMGCKAESTTRAIEETVKVMNMLRKEIPSNELLQKRLDALNGFVFNVDTPAELVKAYCTYYVRGEPLDTLERIQDALMTASREELNVLAHKYLDPAKLQIFVVADKNRSVKNSQGSEVTLEKDLRELASRLDLPYREIELR